MATLLPEGKQSFTNSAGAPLIGGKLYTYDAGTSTPRTTYQDAAGTVPNTNPIILDSRGEATIFWDGSYKVILTDAATVTIWAVDNVRTDSLRVDLAVSTGAMLVGYTPAGVGGVSRTLQAKERETVSVKDFGAVGDGVTDDTAAFLAACASLGVKGGKVRYHDKHLINNNLTVPSNVTILGPMAFVGSPVDNSSTPYGVLAALILNSTKTISLGGGAGIKSCLIYRKGMTFPSSDSSAFAGTAVTAAGDDCFLATSMVLGFDKAFYSTGKQRPKITDVMLDNLNGVHIDACFDIAYLTRVHSWPFATIAAGGAASTLRRPGTAIHFSNGGDWNKVTDCFSYAYARSVHIEACNSVTIQGCGADSTGSYAGQIGFMVTGNSEDTRLVNCQAAAQETGYYVSTASGVQTRLTGCDSWACTIHGVLVDAAGDVKVQGGIHRNTGNAVTLNNATSTVSVNGIRTKAISGVIFNVVVPTTGLTIGTDNNYGDWAAGASIANNATHVIRSVASADPLNLPAQGEFFQVTGSTSFGTMNGAWVGRKITLKFSGTLTVSDGGASLKLNGSLNATPDTTLSLIHDGVAWLELARSVN